MTTVASSSSDRSDPRDRARRGEGLDGQRRLPLAGLDQQAGRPAPASGGARGGHPALRRRAPSAPPSSATRGSWSRASGGISAIASVGTYGALATRTSTRPRSVGGQRRVRGHLRTPGRRRRCCGGRTARRRGRCRRRAARRRPSAAASATPTAPEPQHRSTTTVAAAAASGAAACSTSNSVRRRGTKTPGSTAIRSPQNSAQPRTCSSGRPATRRSPWRRARPASARRRRAARLVLGEDTAGGAQGGDDVGERAGVGKGPTVPGAAGSVAGVLDAHRQTDFALRLDWGPTGAGAISSACDVAVVVDVLSFTTTVTVAADRGIGVLPYRWGDDGGAQAVAAAHGATLAVGRSRARHGEVSLSPLERAGGAGSAPARAAVAQRLHDQRPAGGSGARGRRRQPAEPLRGSGLAAGPVRDGDLRVALICAGERWPDGTLRPAVEDLWGAGALVDLLLQGGWRDVAPEAARGGGRLPGGAG